MTTKRQPAPRKQPGKSRPPGRKGYKLPAWLSTERAVIGGSLVVTVVIILVIALSSANTGVNRSREIEGVDTFTIPAVSHTTTPVVYAQTPPVGGPHHPSWQQCGVYTEPIKNEHAVHSLEHGAVWITYQPDLPESQVSALAGIAQRGTHRLLSPYPGIDSPIIVSAWGLQLRLESADDPRLMDFILKYEQGAQTPEPGATCRGGVTTTAST